MARRILALPRRSANRPGSQQVAEANTPGCSRPPRPGHALRRGPSAVRGQHRDAPDADRLSVLAVCATKTAEALKSFIGTAALRTLTKYRGLALRRAGIAGRGARRQCA